MRHQESRNANKHTETPSSASKHFVFQMDYYLAADWSVTGRDPAHQGQEMKMWFSLLSFSRDELIRGWAYVVLSGSLENVMKLTKQEVRFGRDMYSYIQILHPSLSWLVLKRTDIRFHFMQIKLQKKFQIKNQYHGNRFMQRCVNEH